jgi:hypothetical protein
MALLNESVNEKKWDVRMIERNLARGVVTSEELAQAVAALPDDAECADWVSLESLSDSGEEASSASTAGSSSASASSH